jgi:hypothetical protein
LDIDNALAVGHELLSEQMTEAVTALYCPAALGPTLRPGAELIDLLAAARTRNSASTASVASTATAVCDPLCGSIPMITSAMPGLLLHRDRTGIHPAVGMSDSGSTAISRL